MIGGHIDGGNVKQESLLGGVVEEYGIDDFSIGGQPEGDIADPEDDFDVRDLLLDETD